MFHGNAARLDDVDEDHDNADNNKEFDFRKFHVDAAELDDVDNYDEEFNATRFCSISKSMKESLITAIIQANKWRLHTLSGIQDANH